MFWAIQASPWERENWDPEDPATKNDPVAVEARSKLAVVRNYIEKRAFQVLGTFIVINQILPQSRVA